MSHAQSPKEIVLELYKLALEKLDPKTAFETYVLQISLNTVPAQ